MRRSWVGWPGVRMALASAALFGASTPFAKLLLGEGIDPWLLAGLLYLGAGAGLALTIALRRRRRLPRGEAPLRRADLPWLALVHPHRRQDAQQAGQQRSDCRGGPQPLA
jgi:hypothetical protein